MSAQPQVNLQPYPEFSLSLLEERNEETASALMGSFQLNPAARFASKMPMRVQMSDVLKPLHLKVVFGRKYRFQNVDFS